MNSDRLLTPEKAIQRAQELCARQERCSYDIRMKLRRWQVSPGNIEKIITKLQSDGFINDERYARMFVREKSQFNKWGPLKIAYALKLKQLPEDIVKIALSETDPSSNSSTLIDLLSIKMKGIKAKSTYDLKVKLIRFGVSRGFEFDLVSKTVSQIIKEAQA